MAGDDREDEIVRVASSGVGIDGAERKRRQALVRLAISAGLLVVGAGIAVAAPASQVTCAPVCFPALGILWWLLSTLSTLVDRRPALVPGVVTVRDGALEVLDASGRVLRWIRLDQITQGFWEEPDLVLLSLRSREAVIVRAHDAAEGDRLLHACGVTAAERVLRVPLASAASRIPGGPILAGLALAFVFCVVVFWGMVFSMFLRELIVAPTSRTLLGGGVMAILGTPLAGLGLGLIRALQRREAVVGTDGIVFRRALRKLRIPYDEVTGVLPDARGVRLLRRGASPVVLPTQGAVDGPLPERRAAPGVHVPEAEARRNALLARIEEAMAMRDQGAVARPGLDLLDRRGRSIAAWREELAKLLDEGAGYRRTGLTAGDLAGVVEDASASVERRIAAAVALATKPEDEARQRVRIAAQACADDELRRALESAAEGEIDEDLVMRQDRRA
ncbi:MAG: hypothetical protein QM820_41905 [Minicystis sp.]